MLFVSKKNTPRNTAEYDTYPAFKQLDLIKIDENMAM